MKISYNTQIEVSQTTYNILFKHFTGILAFREHNGRYYIKRMLMVGGKALKRVIEANPIQIAEEKQGNY